MTLANSSFQTNARFSSLHTPVVDILACTYPILCAGMGGVARAPLAAAVSEAGGFGCMGMVREKPEFIDQQIKQFRTLSDKNFAVNIIPAATDPQLLNEQIEVLLESRLPAVCLFWDVVPAVLKRFIDARITVIHQVGSLQDALLALDAGADILIAQGVDAGGHVRGAHNVYTLLPEICQHSPVPVLAAGGIATGKAITTAMLLGAQGVCCGSVFLATHESNAHDYHKQRVVKASADDTVHTRIFHINWPASAPVRVLRNSVTETVSEPDSNPNKKTAIGEQDGQPVYLYSTDSPLAGASGELEKMALYAGRSCGDITDICSAADRVKQLVVESQSAFAIAGYADNDAETNSATTRLRSSPCMANEIQGDYGGYCNDDELYDALLELLAAERAGAKVCAYSLSQAGHDFWHELLLSVHRDEARSCAALIRCIEVLGRRPHTEIGNFFDKCMAIDDLTARITLLNKGQAWVVRKLGTLLPRISQPAIRTPLQRMRDEHNANIVLTTRLLEQAG